MGKCDTCAYKNIAEGGCPVFHADMSGHDGCPYYSTELHTCDICGMVIFGKAILTEENDKWYGICPKCCNAAPCQTCVNQYCAFQQDDSCQEPPYVMREVRQGNMVMQTQVMNPKRIEATCRKNCPCFNEDGLDNGTFCGRQNGCGCDKYKTNWRR